MFISSTIWTRKNDISFNSNYEQALKQASSISAIYLTAIFILFLPYSNFIKKQAFKCLFKIPGRREIDNATFYFLIFPVKNFKWKHHFYDSTSWNYLLLGMAVCWGCISKRGNDRGGEAEHWWATFVWYTTVDTMWRNLQYLAVVI